MPPTIKTAEDLQKISDRCHALLKAAGVEVVLLGLAMPGDVPLATLLAVGKGIDLLTLHEAMMLGMRQKMLESNVPASGETRN